MTDARSPWDPDYNAPTSDAPTVPPARPKPGPDPDQTEVVWAPQPIAPRTGVEGGGPAAPGTAAWERPGGLAPEPPPWSPAAKATKKKLPGAAIAAIAAGLAVVAAVAAYLVVGIGSTHTATTPAAIQRPVSPTTAPKATAPAAAPASAGSSAGSSGKTPAPSSATGGSSGTSSSGSSSSGSSAPASSSSSSGSSSSGGAPSGSSGASTPTTADQGGCGCADIAPPAADNLPATPELKQELARALAAHLGIPASAVDGTYPGTVYYGLDTSTGVNYAVAAVQPSASTLAMNAPTVSPYGFYEENPWAFEQQPNGSWEVDPNGGISPMSTSCPADFPAAVLQVWGQTPGACHFPTGS